MKTTTKKLIALLLLTAMLLGAAPVAHGAIQMPLKGVQDYPSLPQPYHMLDWQDMTLKFIDLVTDENAEGQYFPLISWNPEGYRGVDRSFAFASYVGRDMTLGGGESVTLFSMLLSATLMGLDMRDYKGEDFLDTTEVYYTHSIGTYFNNPGSMGGQTFWYELFPAMLHTMLVTQYPDEALMKRRDKNSADAWYDACVNLGGADLDFDCVSYDFITKQKVIGRWKEPDAAAGIAFIEYMNYILHGDEKYLEAAKWCMDWLEEIEYNPLYEVMGYYAALIGARMNAEQGTNYSIGRFLNWMPGNDSRPRVGWGVINQNWSGYDCYGIAGSEPYAGGYAFAMNTFVQSSAIAPVARYDGRYADMIGKWLLNAANAVRLFYPNQLPEGHETSPDLEGDPEGVIPYEGMRASYNNKKPIAMGDPLLYGWAKTDRSLYSGAPSGMMAAMMDFTEIEGIMRFDLLKTDYAHGDAYPTYLYYNPYQDEKAVTLSLADGSYDLYDSASGRYLMQSVSGDVSVPLSPLHSTVVVVLPAGVQLENRGAYTYAGDVLVGSARSGLILNSPVKGANVSGALDVSLTAFVESYDAIESLKITLGGDTIYEGPYADALRVDTSKVASGTKKLRAHITTRQGYVETDEAEVKVSNNPSVIASYTPNQMEAQWESIPSMPASIKRVGAQVLITETGSATWGGAQSPWFFIDLDRASTLTLEVGKTEPCVAIQLYLDGAPWGYYLLGDTSLDDRIQIDVRQALENYHPDVKFEGVHAARLYLLATGQEGATVGVKRLSLKYD